GHVDIDLTPDLRVSRPHARISFADGQYWIEDLNSANGTEVEGQPIKGLGMVRLEPRQKIATSDTIIEDEIPESWTTLCHEWETAARTWVDTHDNLLDIAESIDAATQVFGADRPIDPERAQGLALLYELPLRFGEETELDTLFQTIIERLVEIIPAASRGALLLEDQVSGELLLKAHIPAGQPDVRMRMAEKAIKWVREDVLGVRAQTPFKVNC